MPQGKGTYGKQVGRPPAKQRALSENEKKMQDKPKKHDAHVKTTERKMFMEGKTVSGKDAKMITNPVPKEQIKKDLASNRKELERVHKNTVSPLEYAPFKMKAASHGNSPMRKNFGIGDSEMPIKTAPVKFGFRGLASKLFGRNKEEQQPEQPQDPMAQATQAARAQAQPQAQSTMQQEMAAAGAEQAGGAEGEAIPPHGPEAHTGGAGPIGGMQKKKAQAIMGGAGSFLF